VKSAATSKSVCPCPRNARVEKQPGVNEEVRVGKRAVQNTQRVSDNVRHEELRVDKGGDVDVNSEMPRKDKVGNPRPKDVWQTCMTRPARSLIAANGSERFYFHLNVL